MKDQLKQWCLDRDPSGFLSVKRTITITYKGLDFDVPAEDVSDEIRLRMAAWVKTLATGTPVLPSLAPESELFEAPTQKTKVGLGICHKAGG